MKRKVLIVAHHLTIGGSQKSLIAALNAIDYVKNEVTLYVRKNRLDLLPSVNPNVKVIVNKDPTHYYRKPYSLWCQARMTLCKKMNKPEKAKQIREKMVSNIHEKMMDYEMDHYFPDGSKYDVGIVYIQGYTADILADRINADKKYVFYHISTDEEHEFHERVFAKFDNIIAVSKYVREILAEKLYPEYADKLMVIDNYVDVEGIRADSKKFDAGYPKDKCVLCSCGRLYPVKGFDLAVEAARILKEKGLNFVWYFVGDGGEREKLEKMISEYELTDYIVITGMKDNPYPYMAQCDVYVQPSYEDAQPLSVIESKILGVPVVATKTVGGCDQVQDGVNGLLAEINAESLADGIAKLIGDPALKRQMAEYLKNTDHSKAYRDYCEKWEQLLSK